MKYKEAECFRKSVVSVALHVCRDEGEQTRRKKNYLNGYQICFKKLPSCFLPELETQTILPTFQEQAGGLQVMSSE